MKNILKEITDRRILDISQKGFNYGHNIPEKRERKIVPFLPVAGTILEIKRASPSKGDISPNLDVEKTARAYIEAGTSAISVLTEENYFKGSLKDLIQVAKIAGEGVAVLRKDFLIEPEEIEVAYKCGADAVLLIARILETQKLLEMAEKAFSLGLSILLELRDEEAVLKAFEVLRLAKKMDAENQVVLGVNARDLKTFTIDMLIPLKIKNQIEHKFMALSENERPSKIRVISESGVLNPVAASLTGALGFDGILIGEAVAKNPEGAKNYVENFVSNANKKSTGGVLNFWKKISGKINLIEQSGKYRPLVKICGITNSQDAIFATECGADILGFICEKKFGRHVDLEKVESIKNDVINLCNEKMIPPPAFVGVITMNDSEESKVAHKFMNDGIFDAIQFHGCKVDIAFGYEAVRVADENQIDELKKKVDDGAVRILLDAYVPNVDGGTGTRLPDSVVKKSMEISKLWLAGGINADNVKEIVHKFTPELIDVSSGVEKEIGIKDYEKLFKLFSELK